jgi:hypothetical protein
MIDELCHILVKDMDKDGLEAPSLFNGPYLRTGAPPLRKILLLARR